MVAFHSSAMMRFAVTGQVMLSSDETCGHDSWVPLHEPLVVYNWSAVLGSRTHFRSDIAVWSAVCCVPLRIARSGARALWCQTVMSRVQGNTINTMARMSLLFGMSGTGCLARHYLKKNSKLIILQVITQSVKITVRNSEKNDWNWLESEDWEKSFENKPKWLPAFIQIYHFAHRICFLKTNILRENNFPLFSSGSVWNLHGSALRRP